MTKNCILIFTRNPELGKVKTRLAKTIGDEKALKIYQFLLKKTQEVAQKVSSDKVVFYSEKITENDNWNPEIFQKYLQVEGDLGVKMQHAFKQSFEKGYEKVAIIGSDLFDLTPEIIQEAFHALETHEVVIGPAKDGGYYLLGMKKLYQSVFENKNWGTATVLKETLEDLTNKKVFLLEELNDVDVFEDIEFHPAFQQFFD
ncbi:MAG: glycosyltransferase [Flavobacteriia bacterium]|nr:glycosyltransferase [Flavobacteriia bacterium]NCT60512.1 glycosyltransferase [Flavobacteriia bacterium]OIP47076.1 MAG: glycosyltransferase [Flavobacteriaceae bacterium CG2_30_31_66]PIX15383.1 MAG: glycosyltransferase [Flavobacteriaceae bacterium CG_4_8_14_3_um_filter_31_8]